ncbi:MAG: response regulator transcription factor [Chitinophagaceae bacterium]|nr:response regulator transcription factor [Chitinophagaceae bacterium]
MMRALIIDDEKKGITILQQLLKKHCPQVEIAGSTQDPLTAASLIKEQRPDLIFIDIEMPGMNGFEVLQAFNEVTFQVIFTTAYNEYAVKAIRFSALDYLLKPIEVEELKAAVQRMENKMRTTGQRESVELFFQNLRNLQSPFARITLSTSDGILVQEVKDILYCEATGSYTTFHLRNKEKIMVSKGIGEFEGLLSEHHFFRVHHSFLINMKEIKKYIRGDGGTVMLSNGVEIDVAKRRKDQFLAALHAI